ncbi:alanine racemase [Marinilactibacillus sp. Marseille-P9653]|uniref:alanine racemase n=1 Tax=Marinilactibacillus sp. Marseille-P9653 TaxID=2866583 RepID=UPI001CE3D89E|nr:alanine racemase [Marinilactibacillus sp. Marseille-P9653]
MTAILTFNQQRLFEQARSLQEKQDVIVVVKNNAYNFGMERAYRAFYKAGIRSYATTNLEEAVWLRKQDDQTTVLLLDPSTEFDILREHDISLTLPNLAFYHQYKEHLEGIKIHLVFKNLLNRFGFDTADEMKTVFDEQLLTITGIWTHFAFADELLDNRYEIEKENWSNVLTVLEPYLDTLTFIHAQNSASYLRDGLFDQHTHIRAGVIAYGTRPYYDLPESLAMQTIEVSATVKDVVSVPKGQSAGYSAAFVAAEDTTLAICDIGYGNGILRTRSKHKVMINQKTFPIAVLMMSHLMVKVDTSVSIGDRVYLYNDTLRLDYFTHKGVGAFSEQMASLNHQTFKITNIPLSE